MEVNLTGLPAQTEAPPIPKSWTFYDEHAKVLGLHGERIAVLEAVQTTSAAAMTRLEAEMAKLVDKIDKVNAWLLGSLFTACLALVGMVIALLKK